MNKVVLVCCILDFGQGSKALQAAQNAGALGQTIILGRGTVQDRLLKFLGAYEVRKEILVAAVASRDLEENLYGRLDEKFNLHKPQTGIAFSLPLGQLAAIDGRQVEFMRGAKGGRQMLYEAIFVIVNKGLSVEVLEAAQGAGSTGGTVIHGRGSGTEEKAKLFNIAIEPEKDIVLILSKREKTEDITGAIEKRLRITEPGAGIIFVLGVSRTLGLYEGAEEVKGKESD